MDAVDWRTQLQNDSRQRIVNKIMETLKRHLPFSGQEGIMELKKIAERFEEKIYSAATSQSDYLRKISMKMLTMETKSQATIPNSLPNSSANSSKPLDAGASMQNQGQTASMQLSANQPQVQQQLLSQNMQNNNMASAGVQGSAGLQSSLPPVSGLNQTPIPSMVNQNPSMQNVSQNSVGNSMGQGVPSNMFANSQRQMPGRQQVVPQQQQQTSQNSQQFLLHPQQLLNKKFPQGNLSNTLVQPHMQQPQQQHQQNLLQQTQLQNSQPTGMQTSSMAQPSMIQSSGHSSLQQNPPSSVQQSTQSMLQQHPQLRPHQQPQQTASIHQQQTSMVQQPLLPSQQQQLLGQSSNASNIQQNQLIGQQTSGGEMQQQQQQRMLGQQSLQQQQQQRQLMSQQNNLTSMHQQQMGPQSNVSGFQQQQHQQLLGTQSSNSGMQNAQHPAHMMQQPKIQLQHQPQQNVPNMLGSQGQQSQMQPGQQQIMPQIQSQSSQMQQLGMQQQQQQQQRLQAQGQAPGSLLQSQNVIDQQKQQLYQAQRPHPETSSTSLDSTAETGHVSGGDWQEEVYQKIKSMKDRYSPELNDMYQKIAAKLQQHNSLPQQPKSEQLEKLKIFKKMLERIIAFLQVSKNNVLPGFKEKLASYEMQILNCLNTNRPRKIMPSMQQGQLVQPHMEPMQQSQPLISQAQAQAHENQMNSQMQSMNSQGAGQTTQQSNVLHNSMSSLPGASAPQQTVMNSLQPGSSMDTAQGNQLSSMQQVTSGPIQQGSAGAPQQLNINPLTTQSGVNLLPTNNSLQPNSNILQHQHLKQQQEMLQSQQLKQIQHRQLLQKQQMLQQQQQNKQQLPVSMQAHQMSQLNQMNDVTEMKHRAGMGVKPGVFQQHLQSNQRPAYPHQQMKPGASFPISPSQLLQATSPQLPQHSSPQIDQQNLLSSLTKNVTPLQSAGSPFIVPSPSTPLTPSTMPGDTEKPISGVSSLANAANIGHQPASSTQAQAQSLAIGTPGISASPLLAEFTGTDAMPAVSGKSTVTEQPLERLIRVVKSMDSKALSASVSDIGSVVSMIDRIAGSAPGNGSRAAVGEDLVAMTKCRLQARNFITQDGMSGNRKMRRQTSAMPLNIVSSAGSVSDSFKRLLSPETSDLESTATSRVKRPRIEANHALLEEIREINQQLIDTVVDINDEDVNPTTAASAAAEGSEGTIVKCCFSAVALCPTLKAQYASTQMSPIEPLRLLVPTNYPNCSPVLLDKLPVEVSKEYEDISMKAKSKFSISLRSLSQPMSLGDIARTWDFCARAVISEHAQRSGGGTFSSKYGTWENCLSAV